MRVRRSVWEVVIHWWYFDWVLVHSGRRLVRLELGVIYIGGVATPAAKAIHHECHSGYASDLLLAESHLWITDWSEGGYTVNTCFNHRNSSMQTARCLSAKHYHNWYHRPTYASSIWPTGTTFWRLENWFLRYRESSSQSWFQSRCCRMWYLRCPR